MRAIRKSSSHQPCAPNILPCRVQHNGPVEVSPRYWAPVPGKNGTNTAYFRGRKLYGRAAKVPQGYKGVVLVGSEKILKEAKKENGEEKGREEDVEDDDEEEEEEVKIMEEVGDFDEVMIWGHEAVADDDDVYVRSLEEWIGVAESINSFAGEGADSKGPEGEVK